MKAPVVPVSKVNAARRIRKARRGQECALILLGWSKAAARQAVRDLEESVATAPDLDTRRWLRPLNWDGVVNGGPP